MSTDLIVKELKPYSANELATFYQISDKTFKRWITPFNEEIGKKEGRYYNVLQVKTIFERLGIPGTLA